MSKLWLTDKAHSIWGSLFRIGYWLLAIYLSSLYLQNFQQQSWFKFGLMGLSLLFVVVFLLLIRLLDRFFKTPES